MDKKESELRAEYETLQKKLQDPAIFSSREYPKIAKRQSFIEDTLALFDKISSIKAQVLEAQQLSSDKDKEVASLAQEEVVDLDNQLQSLSSKIQDLLTPRDPNNDKDVIIEIRAAAGGDEASLFAGDLFRMYSRWAENNGYKTELINESPGVTGGFKEISFAVRGEEAYKNLKFEGGVHRVQRVPETESQGRIHTSTATVAAMPEAEETDIEINDGDLKVDTYRASGHGGQSVNTTDSAVRITHLPSGIVVTCQDEKSQLKNKAKAMGVLRSRLLQKKINDEQKELSDARLKLIGSGDRSEKIRTYNFPQDRITDHRIGYSRSNIPAALDGNIDDLIEELLKAENELMSKE